MQLINCRNMQATALICKLSSGYFFQQKNKIEAIYKQYRLVLSHY